MHNNKVIVNKAPKIEDLLGKGAIILRAVTIKKDKQLELQAKLFFVSNDDAVLIEHQLQILDAEIKGLQECIKDYDQRFQNSPAANRKWEVYKLHVLENLAVELIAERCTYDRSTVYRTVKSIEAAILDNQ